ncbi:tellerium resistance protein TerY [alpha proteobacterium AAP38]|jgi:uncharacterized protein YegL|uniref:vWA domain-containing protein n=1 Tax=Niveispirillum sp. TaxID=1917217 RepID=UPI0006B9C32A|nr:tellerium resistance protein TerY [alpha proteobacterium AAP38]
MRRLPVYLLLDTSGSMRGEPIQAVNVGLRAMISALRQDPHALESVWVSIITFNRSADVLMPLTPVDLLQLPDIVAPESGVTHMGLGMETLIEQVRHEVTRNSADRKGDWAPLLFVMTDGSPSDIAAYQDAIPVVKGLGFGNIVGCAAGPKAKLSYLLELTPTVVSLDTMDSASFGQFFSWVSAAVARGNRSQGLSAAVDLPPPPPELQVVT